MRIIKKITSIILIFTFLSFFLLSCGKKEDKKLNYIFIHVDATILKINTDTGAATTLCSDPLCDHKSSTCPFFNSNSGNNFFASKNNDIIYYIANTMNPVKYFIKSYNLIEGKFDKIYETQSEITQIFYLDDYILFTETKNIFYDKNNQETMSDVYHFNVKDKKVIKLNDESLKGVQIPQNIINDRIDWLDETGKRYTTTFDYTDKSYDEKYWNTKNNNNSDWQLKFENGEENKVRSLAMFKFNKKTNEKIMIDDNIVVGKKCGDKYLYYKYSKEKKIIGEDEKKPDTKYSFSFDNKLYSINLDGSDNIILCEFGNDCYFNSIMQFGNYDPSFGDYRLVNFINYKFDPDGKVTSRDNNKFAVVNIKTGDFKFVTIENYTLKDPDEAYH